MKYVFAFLILSAALGAVLSFFLNAQVRYRVPDIVNAIATEEHVEEAGRIVFVGDIMMARDVERKMGMYGAAYPFSHMLAYFTGDAVVGNFEAAIPAVHVPTPSMVMQFSVSETYVSAPAEAGFTHMSLANNHADDYGVQGYEETVRALSEAAIVPFGSPYALDPITVSYVESGGKRIALIGVYAVEAIPGAEAILEMLRQVSAESDLQIAYVHWGVEYELIHHPVQESLAHTLVDAGVDAVIGHHPHVVQDIERYGAALIFYSLGNFIFDQYWNSDVSQGLLLEVAVDPEEGLAYTLVPVSTEGSRTAPRAITGFERETFLDALAARSDTELAASIRSGVVR